MMRIVTIEASKLEAMHKELKTMNQRLTSIEGLIEEVIVKDLPKVKVSKRELNEIKKSISEMKRGRHVTLEELRSA
jgi:tetrahydromethanopterin S-methyltransferase subunit G